MRDEQGNLTDYDVTFKADDVVGTFASPVTLTNDRSIKIAYPDFSICTT